jgi:hypothetical protein
MASNKTGRRRTGLTPDMIGNFLHRLEKRDGVNHSVFEQGSQTPRMRGSIRGTGARMSRKPKQKKKPFTPFPRPHRRLLLQTDPTVERRHGDAAGPPPNGQASHRTDQLTSPPQSASRTHESEEEKKECARTILAFVLAFPARSNDFSRSPVFRFQPRPLRLGLHDSLPSF